MGVATFKSRSVALGSSAICQRRYSHVVQHNLNRGTFYVQLDDESRAILQYKKADGNILDMQSITVPAKYRGQGLARLLAETAFTYAIVNSYYMYLRCEYLQKYYLAVKNFDLEKRVIGPSHILEGPDSVALDPDVVYELPDPENFKL